MPTRLPLTWPVSGKPLVGPPARAHEGVGLDQPAAGRDQQPQRGLRNRVVEHVGRVADEDPTLEAGVDVDVLVADALVGDHAEPRQRGDEVGVDETAVGAHDRDHVTAVLREERGAVTGRQVEDVVRRRDALVQLLAHRGDAQDGTGSCHRTNLRGRLSLVVEEVALATVTRPGEPVWGLCRGSGGGRVAGVS